MVLGRDNGSYHDDGQGVKTLPVILSYARLLHEIPHPERSMLQRRVPLSIHQD